MSNAIRSPVVPIAALSPKSSSRAPIIGWLLCGLALLLSGCSALRVGYGQAPTLAYWWLDGYADFDAIQKPRVRAALGDWFAWHRRTQLADYARLIAQGQAEVLADTTPERACVWWADLTRRVDALVEPAAAAAAPIVLTLTSMQIDHIEQHYAKLNAEYRDAYLQADPAERRKEAVERVVKQTETLYGPIDEPQRARIAKLTAESPFDPDVWLAERQRRQQDALAMLRKLTADGATREQTQAALRSYFAGLQRSPREAYRKYNERLTQANCAFSASLHNMTTPAQRQTAAQKLKGWEADLRALAADAP